MNFYSPNWGYCMALQIDQLIIVLRALRRLISEVIGFIIYLMPISLDAVRVENNN